MQSVTIDVDIKETVAVEVSVDRVTINGNEVSYDLDADSYGDLIIELTEDDEILQSLDIAVIINHLESNGYSVQED